MTVASIGYRYRLLYDCGVDSNYDVAAALRQIARGFDALADAFSVRQQPGSTSEQRALAVLREWGHRGLTRAEASALFRKHGFAPQTAGGWARGDWIRTTEDDRRHLTRRSQEWMAAQEELADE